MQNADKSTARIQGGPKNWNTFCTP